MRKTWALVMAAAMAAASLTACSSSKPAETATPETETEAAETEETEAEAEAAGDQQEILVAAAASLQYVMEDKIQPAFEKENPDIKLSFTFDSSGKLQTQIEEGADADVFFSAATKQMNALEDEGLVDADSVVELLENKIALIVPKDSHWELPVLRISQRQRRLHSAIRRVFRLDSTPRKPLRTWVCGMM